MYFLKNKKLFIAKTEKEVTIILQKNSCATMNEYILKSALESLPKTRMFDGDPAPEIKEIKLILDLAKFKRKSVYARPLVNIDYCSREIYALTGKKNIRSLQYVFENYHIEKEDLFGCVILEYGDYPSLGLTPYISQRIIYDKTNVGFYATYQGRSDGLGTTSSTLPINDWSGLTGMPKLSWNTCYIEVKEELCTH